MTNRSDVHGFDATSSQVNVIATNQNPISLSETDEHLSFWKEFDLDGRRLLLDKNCSEMRDFKTASINGRKKLNELTKTFRSLSKEEQQGMMLNLLKEYQDEVDQLSRRSKFAEASFYSLYKSLYEAPDPATTIEQLLYIVTNSSTYQLEVEKLKAELIQYELEFQQLKNQDITIRKLEEAIQEYKDNIDVKVQEEIQRSLVEIESQYEHKLNAVHDLQRAAEKRLATSLEMQRLAQEQADNAQSQVFEISSQAESRISHLQSENSILAENLQRCISRIAELESIPNSQYSINSDENLKDGDDSKSNHLALQQILVNELRLEMHRKDESFRLNKQKYETLLKELSLQLASEQDNRKTLQLELSKRPSREDYLMLRHQFRTLQQTAFNIEDVEFDKEEEPIIENDHLQFETVLTKRLKFIEVELAESKRLLSQVQESESLSKQEISKLNAALTAANALVKKLEHDLDVKYSTTVIDNPNLSINDGGLAKLLNVEIEVAEVKSAPLMNQNQLVSILQAQRDRYKENLTDSESKLSSSIRQTEILANAKSQLETENLSLYSKIRFLQSYIANPTNSKHRSRSWYDDDGDGHSDSVDIHIEKKYQGMYEQKINPFEEFSQFERQRKLNELSVADRMVLNTINTLVANQTSRT